MRESLLRALDLLNRLDLLLGHYLMCVIMFVPLLAYNLVAKAYGLMRPATAGTLSAGASMDYDYTLQHQKRFLMATDAAAAKTTTADFRPTVTAATLREAPARSGEEAVAKTDIYAGMPDVKSLYRRD